MRTSFDQAKDKLKRLVRQLVDLDFTSKGTSKRQSLESAREQLRKQGRSAEELEVMFKELQPVEIEKGTEHLLMVFAALSASRGEGINGPCAITYVEMKTYCDLMDEQLSPWEIETLREMDRAFLAEVTKKQEHER